MGTKKTTLSHIIYSFSLLISSVLFLVLSAFNTYAETSISSQLASAVSLPIGTGGAIGTSAAVGLSTVTGSGTVLPDTFTGTMRHSIPIEVPAGRKGMNPDLALTYRSNNGSGWVGVGWDLEVGAIERSTKKGVSYTGDEYVLRMAGSGIELINVNGEYRAKIESGFFRIRKLTASDGKMYWEVTDKNGVRYLYGQSADSRQDDPGDPSRDIPSDPNKIFKWCLDYIEDPNGNYTRIGYNKNPEQKPYEGQIYLDRIDYTGHTNGLQPTNSVKFFLETRTDAPNLYTTNFRIKTDYRLKTIDVSANGGRVRKYELEYGAYSGSTPRSLLAKITQYGSDGVTTLPPIEITYQAAAVRLETAAVMGSTTTSHATSETWPADLDGDGRADILYFVGGFYAMLSKGDSFEVSQSWGGAELTGSCNIVWVADMDGDGRADVVYRSGNNYYMLRSTGSTFEPKKDWGSISLGTDETLYWESLGDVDGDSLLDVVYITRHHIYPPRIHDGFEDYYEYKVHVLFSTGSGSRSAVDLRTILRMPSNLRLADFNGDNRADIVYTYGYYYYQQYSPYYVMLSTGNGFSEDKMWGQASQVEASLRYEMMTDVNGDGLADIVYRNLYNPGTDYHVLLSTGSGFLADTVWGKASMSPGNYIFFGMESFIDVNGDGRADIVYSYYSDLHVLLSTGSGFQTDIVWGTVPPRYAAGPLPEWFADVNGDGLMDMVYAYATDYYDTTLDFYVLKSSGPFSDLLATVSNNIGDRTTFAYKPSTQYTNTQLPFPIQTVSAVTTNDGNGVVSTTTYEYSSGFYHISERDFRGFNHVTVTVNAAGPAGEQKVTETWFHQGKDTAVDANDPNVFDGYMKGKPYRTRIRDVSSPSNLYSETTISYASQPDGTATPPYFNPPYQVDTYNCDGKLGASCAGNASAQHLQTIYTYDNTTGNVVREDQRGDLADSTDDRTIVRSYSPNSDKWILGLPYNESIYKGIGTAGNPVSSTTVYYDEPVDCTFASLTPVLQPPTKGNPTRTVRSLDGVNDPSVRMAYDDNYGNLVCSRDARGNVSTVSYDDSSFTFPTENTTPRVGTNPLGYKTTIQYYGVDGVQADNGLYGQVKSVSALHLANDQNPPATITEYDTFGRKTKMTNADGTWTSWSYPITPGTGTSTNTFGAIGAQHIQTDTAVGISSWTYFDGLGRTIIEKKTGPGEKKIARLSKYNKTGTVSQTSLPYFDGIETPRMTGFKYDPMGRIIHVDNPDGTSVDRCYNNGVTVVIDADKHRKRETKNAQGKLIKVEEYLGTYTTGCTTDSTANSTTGIEGPYAMTTYAYDVLGNLLNVIDAEVNQTTIQYDTLGRKVNMRDPDMGYWTYVYDANGNLTKQTDARGQIITFTYDSLNRVTKKHYPRLTFGPDVVYTYDVSPASYPTYTTYPIGRLTTMTDASGTTTLFYDNMGRTKKTIKTIAGTDYPIGYAYTLGRLTSVTYPDGDVVNYSYDGGGNLIQAADPSTNKAYATYANLNAFAQPGNVTYGNGVTTTYQYYPTNNRLMDIMTLDPASQKLLSLTYNYSDGGNVNAIADNIDSTRSQTFIYDDINRLIQAQSMSYGTQWYAYDQIGNILSKEGVSYTYTDSSGATIKPHAVKSTTDGKTYTYDANGNMISNGVQSITYDYDNMPRSVISNGATTTFVYDGGGARAKKATSSGATLYIGKLYECKDGTCSKYIFAGGSRLALKSGTNTYYYHQDHLGSTAVVTGPDGSKQESIYYYPFGAAKEDDGGVSVTHKYTSQELDAETGLYYYGARYYNPSLGRFISPDTIVPDFSQPQSLNRYSYALNNPLKYVDPTGHFSAETGGNYDLFGSSNWQTGYWLLDNTVMPFLNDVNNIGGYVGNTFTNGLGYGLGLAYDAENYVLRDVLGGSQADVEAFNIYFALAGAGWSEFGQLNKAAQTSTGVVRGDSILANEVGAIGPATGEGFTTLFRAVGEAEYGELMQTGKFAAGPNSLPGKFFAESAEHAAQWGELIPGAGNFRVIEASVPTTAADQFMRWGRLDGIGPARYGELEQLRDALLRGVHY